MSLSRLVTVSNRMLRRLREDVKVNVISSDFVRKSSCRISEEYVVSLIHDPEVIYRILSHLDLLEDEPQKGTSRSPPFAAGHSPGELVCEPFFDDLPAGEFDQDHEVPELAERVHSIVNAATN